MSVKIFKLVNGDEIITEVGEENGITFKNPARLMMFPDPGSGGMGMALVPWCPYVDKKNYNIEPIHVIITIDEKEIPEELIGEYREKFGSGIVTPPKQELIL